MFCVGMFLKVEGYEGEGHLIFLANMIKFLVFVNNILVKVQIQLHNIIVRVFKIL
jgi:hypothetical protein